MCCIIYKYVIKSRADTMPLCVNTANVEVTCPVIIRNRILYTFLDLYAWQISNCYIVYLNHLRLQEYTSVDFRQCDIAIILYTGRLPPNISNLASEN